MSIFKIDDEQMKKLNPLIGDGRGRTSLAVGMGINKLQTFLLESK